MMPHWARTLSPKAILVGGIADIVATNIALAPLAVFVFARDPAALNPGYESTAVFAAALEASPSLYSAALLLGSACSVLGGWVAARIAKRAALLNGAFSAYGCLLLSAYGFIATPSAVPTWQFIALPILATALGASGGMLFERRVAVSRNAPLPEPTGFERQRSRSQRVLLVANRLLLLATTLLAGMYALAILIIPDEDGSHAVMTVVLVISCIAMLCYLIGARALNGGRQSHWAWHVAAGILTLIPSGILALGLWISARAG